MCMKKRKESYCRRNGATIGDLLLDSKLIITENNELKPYDIKLVDCGNYVQIYYYEKKKTRINNDNSDLKLKKIDFKCHENKEDIKLVDINNIEEKNIIRSKLKCQRLAKANIDDWKSFITLTFKENITDIKIANKKFRNYIDTIKKNKKDFKYLCITEFQKRGSIHYHILTNLICDSDFIPKRVPKNLYNPNTYSWKKIEYYDLKYWNNGYSSAEIVTGDIKKIIGYISKYMTKDIDNRLFNHRRYFCSRNLNFPKENYINLENEKDKAFYKKTIQDSKLNYQNEYINPYDNSKVTFLEFIK